MVIMHVWYYGLRGILEKLHAFSSFSVVETLLLGGEECLSATCGLAGPVILVPTLLVFFF